MRRLTRAIRVSTALCTLVLLVAAPARATYPGKNGLIAIGIDRGHGSQIYTIRPNGSDLTRITNGDGSALDPDWSPDGTKIVFDVDATGGTEPCRVEIMNADGTNIVDITPKRIAKRGCAFNPSFTPDGRRIVFLTDCDTCAMTISSINLQGGDRRRIAYAPHGYGLHAPDVSPDGRTILFLAERDAVVNSVEGNRKTLYTVRMNGTHMTQLLPFRFDVCACGGDWAPNGKRIVSSDQIGPTPVPGKSSNLFTIRPDGSSLRYLTNYRAPSPDVNVGPGTYSPNGRWIVFKHADNANGRYVMWKIHPDGSHLTRVRRFRFSFTGRDWGPRTS